jgi:DNA (cytosine-5)-methyltransferase 1
VTPGAAYSVTVLAHRRASQNTGRPLLLDLFCKAGGAGKGYQLAGFDVVGVDRDPQPRYPFEFIRADAIEFLAAGGWQGFEAAHASPPCQAFSSMRALAIATGSTKQHPELVEPVRELLRSTGLPYIIENVPGAPLVDPVKLCGSSFGLDLRRHRLFESNIPLEAPRCAHGWQEPRFEVRIGQPNSRSNGKDRKNPLSPVVTVVGNSVLADEARRVMEMPWATRDECSQAVPPAYTHWLGMQLLFAVYQARAGRPIVTPSSTDFVTPGQLTIEEAITA